jgi:F-type H+-transporting ATPase subunit b
MKADVWTFLFQIVNFVVLLFILKRLLFRPIREIMEKRRATIENAIGEAEEKRREAEALREELGRELRGQKDLRREAEARMRAEVDELRAGLVEEARREAGKVREKERAVHEGEKKKFESDLMERAAATVSLFAENVLRDVSDAELHAGIVRKFLSETAGIAREMAGLSGPGEAIPLSVVSAYPLGEDERGALREALAQGMERGVALSFETDPALIAGLAVRSGDMVHDFSLRGQVRGFTARIGGQGAP